ncbi:MAG: type II toxin-antitoxin system VapC family toxin [Gemmatimonadota bacterium]|nr:type II toxin-antitoxin system VapC family toxin [Gemmatimonadota bacterium]MDE2953092.1 type II toxin-antitoxin system VapC family toxin [Gemmatimonadota bacterium]
MIFVDSGAWIALLNQRDQYHDDAVVIYNGLKQQRAQLLTTDYVIDETATWLKYRANHQVAVQFLDLVESVEKTGVLTVAEIDNSLFQEAKKLFRQYDSVQLSFTDCTSFAVCQKHNISETYAFDDHFAMMGITVLKTVE